MHDIRRTKTRQWTLRAVKISPGAVTAEVVFAMVKRGCPGTGLATVYRNLEFLTKRGEIYQLDGDDGSKRYIGHTFHQTTFHCQRCGKTRQLPSQSLQKYVNQKMFGPQTVFIATLIAQGLCAACAKALKKMRN